MAEPVPGLPSPCKCCNASVARLIFRLPTSRLKMGAHSLCTVRVARDRALLVDIRNDTGGGFMIDVYCSDDDGGHSPLAATHLLVRGQKPPPKLGFLSVAYSCGCYTQWLAKGSNSASGADSSWSGGFPQLRGLQVSESYRGQGFTSLLLQLYFMFLRRCWDTAGTCSVADPVGMAEDDQAAVVIATGQMRKPLVCHALMRFGFQPAQWTFKCWIVPPLLARDSPDGGEESGEGEREHERHGRGVAHVRMLEVTSADQVNLRSSLPKSYCKAQNIRIVEWDDRLSSSYPLVCLDTAYTASWINVCSQLDTSGTNSVVHAATERREGEKNVQRWLSPVEIDWVPPRMVASQTDSSAFGSVSVH